jgi:hypothetical protein
MSAFGDAFEAHLKKFRAAPLLFVGAGLSRRYLALDGWETLLRRMADLTGKDFDYYAASADGDLPQVATLIAEELHDPWWSEARFEKTRDRFRGMLHHRDSALKAEASAYLSASMTRLPASGDLANELELLRTVVIDGIITTNFDPLLDQLFPDFEVFVGQERLLFSEAMGVGEIYKIHGSHEDPDSLVLTRADYERFNERNPYLAAKLTTYFVEHPIVFLGYSLSDENVGAILNAIVRCLDSKESIAKLADRLIFVQWDDTAAPTLAPSIISVEGTPIPVMMATVPAFSEIFGVMTGMKRRFPAKLRERPKSQVARASARPEGRSSRSGDRLRGRCDRQGEVLRRLLSPRLDRRRTGRGRPIRPGARCPRDAARDPFASRQRADLQVSAWRGTARR